KRLHRSAPPLRSCACLPGRCGDAPCGGPIGYGTHASPRCWCFFCFILRFLRFGAPSKTRHTPPARSQCSLLSAPSIFRLSNSQSTGGIPCIRERPCSALVDQRSIRAFSFHCLPCWRHSRCFSSPCTLRRCATKYCAGGCVPRR